MLREEINSRMKHIVQGIRGNIIDLKRKYPKGYIARIYHDKNWEESKEWMTLLCKVYCENSDTMDLCSVRKLYNTATESSQSLMTKCGTLWRFAPMADKLVTEFHSRDLDSRPTEREWAAVNEWLKSNRTYHIMRDSPVYRTPILPGLWGMRFTQNTDRKEIANIFDKILLWGEDYDFSQFINWDMLTKFLWPIAKQDMMAHDSYHCEFFKSPMNQPWPTRRPLDGMNYAGARFARANLTSECPTECRPKNHPEWKLC